MDATATAGKASAVLPRAQTSSAARTQESPAMAPRAAATSLPNTPLNHLSVRTGNLSKWDVSISLPRIEDFEYTWQGEKRKSQVFRCILTSLLDPTIYCLAEVRKEKGQSDTLEKAMNTYKDNLHFRMSKVVLSSKDKPEYNSTKHKVCVDLSKTTMEPLLQSARSALPHPGVTCADCQAFKSLQAFDITCLVDSVSEARNIASTRYVRDVYLLDGSKKSDVIPLASQTAPDPNGDKLVRPKVAVFYTRTGLQDPVWMQELQAAAKQPKPFHFFALQAQMTEGNEIKTETMRGWYKIMPATGPKATHLIENYASINLSMSSATPLTLEPTFQPRGR